MVESRDEKRRLRESLCEKIYEKELRSSLRTLRRYDFYDHTIMAHISLLGGGSVREGRS